MSSFLLEDLGDAIKLFTSTQASFFAENCVVALENNGHESGCTLHLDGIRNETIQINWSTKVSRAGFKEEKKYIEKSAEAVSFLLTRHCTGFQVVEEAHIGTGIDYWLAYDEDNPEYDPDNFFVARLEISGINVETPTNSLMSRVKRKLLQTDTSAETKLPAFVSVVEHSTPKAHFSQR